MQRQAIDQVLQWKRKQREARACYPCRQRKVKCDSGHPCRTCQKRGHPHICAYDIPKTITPRKRQAPRQSAARIPTSTADTAAPSSARSDAASPSRASQGSPSSTDSRRDPDYVFSGENSLVSIIRQQDPDGSMAREAGSVLGLHNTYESYPFIDLKTPRDRWCALLDILPKRAEILKFFHHYRTSAYPFNPILVDVDGFESAICTFLGSHAAGEFSDLHRISERWSSDQSIGQVSLILATLASGAHFSDLENPKRSEACRDLARRSFQALRLANFLFRPSLEIIQALLILGNTLQNNGQSDAAWALLGTTVRLAQALGLHTERGMAHLPDGVRTKAQRLWSMTVWQDCLLSLCYDRPPIVSTTPWQRNRNAMADRDLSFIDVMGFLCQLGLDIAKLQESEYGDPGRSVDLLTALDDVYTRGQPHLLARENCKCLQDHLEHLALRMHVSFCVSVLCRPAIRSVPISANDPRSCHMRSRARESLVNASQAFLDFQTLSIVPLRTWSMVHTVLSSTLLLCIWEETRNDNECRDLQQKVITVFSSADPTSPHNSDPADRGQWLSARHIRALVALRNAVRSAPFQPAKEESNDLQSAEHHNRSMAELDQFVVPDTAVLPGFSEDAFAPGFGDYFTEGAFNATTDLSPVTYLDSIMNVPLFNISEDEPWM
ncbi:hypothetical protein BDV25DRAFT_148974 [Aspergillus avenaceus]|uniref:Zn(2)-C6 fungal-type domain-containing protein n=1 Tax=Aspergillus avenaceus TaxID=36643 RepID=A0A5N6U5L2_ASPAV|nr:hypothetical protein BDV25DRAFT_148974 [Aspergillus avenaceus]